MNIREEKGSALLTVLIVFTVLTILGIPFLSSSITGVRQSIIHKNRFQAYYFARSGAEKAIAWLVTEENLINEEFEELAYCYGSLEDFYFNTEALNEEQDIQVIISKEENEDVTRIKIESYGTYGKGINNMPKVTENVTLYLKVGSTGGEEIIFPDELQNFIVENQMGLFAAVGAGTSEEPALELKGSVCIKGSFGTNSTDFGSIKLGSSTLINGDLYIRTFFDEYSGTIVENPYIPKEEGEPEWTSGWYSTGSKVWYNGLNYIARHGTNNVPENDPWDVLIPEGEIWPWFPFQVYDKAGYVVWYDEKIYISKYWTQGDQPDSSNAWELFIPNIAGNIIYLEEDQVFPEPIFPEFPDNLPLKDDLDIKGGPGNDVSINGSGNYNSIKVSSSRTISIYLNNNEHIKLRVKELDITQGFIDLFQEGENGRLTIYVEETFTLGGSSYINSLGNIQDVTIYYAGENPPNIGGNTIFKGSLFLEQANLTVNGSNSIVGHIISLGDNIEISGAADFDTRIIYAPHTNINRGGSGLIKGAVIANRVTADGGGCAIIYEAPDFSTFPRGIFPSNNENGGSQDVDIDEWR